MDRERFNQIPAEPTLSTDVNPDRPELSPKDPDSSLGHTQPLKPSKPAQSNNKPRKPKKPLLVALACLLLIAGAITALITSGVMYVGFKERGQKVVIRTTSCNDNLLREFQDRVTSKMIQKDYVTDIADKVKQNQDYDNDVNCVYIMAVNAITTNNASDLEEYIERMDNFAKEGLYPNNNIQLNGISVDDLYSVMQQLFAPPPADEPIDLDQVIGV
jgi:hypothetical protein